MQNCVNTFIESVSEAFPIRGPVCEFGYAPGLAQPVKIVIPNAMFLLFA